MNNLHPIQMQILRELLFHPISHFAELNIKSMTSDHFSYHVRELTKLGYIEKLDRGYCLTQEGKEFANRMDTDKNVMEKQPKISVTVCPIKIVDGVKKYAIQTRLKEPYYGYIGFMTGKMRFGETVEEAALRELQEEMGLSGKISYVYLLHEMVYTKQGVMLEDKFFNSVICEVTEGELTNFEGGKNEWMTKEEFMKATPKFHNEVDIFTWFEQKDPSFKEFKYYIDQF